MADNAAMWWRGYIGALAALAVLTTACTSNPSTEPATDETTTTTTMATETGAASQIVGAAPDAEVDVTAPEPGRADDAVWPADLVGQCDAGGCTTPWEDEWRRDRARIVLELLDAGFAVDPTQGIRGPGGMEVDLTRCPADWNLSDGVTDDEIVIGDVRPLSGNLAIFQQEEGFWAYIEWVNRNGGVGGRRIRLEVRDDSYRASNTLAATEELLTEHSPLLVTTIGSGPTQAVAGLLAEECVPQVLARDLRSSGEPDQPWLTSSEFTVEAEARLWVELAERDQLALGRPLRIAAVVMDNEFGHSYRDAFRDALGDRELDAELTQVTHDPAAPTLTDEVAALAAARPDTVIAMTAGNPCLLTIIEFARHGVDATRRLLPSVCDDGHSYLSPVGVDADGWQAMSVRSHLPAGLVEEGSYVDWYRTTMGELRSDPSIPVYFEGWNRAWLLVEVLRIAQDLPGGLNRANVLAAAWAADLRPPGHVPHVGYELWGPADPLPVERAMLREWIDDAWVDIELLH